MRILFVALESPYPPTKGHRIRTWAMIEALAQDGHDVTVIGFEQPEDRGADMSPLRSLCREVKLIPPPRRRLGRLRGLASLLPYGAWRFRSAALSSSIAEAIESGNFDLLLCDGLYNMVNLPGTLPVPVLLNKDDVAHIVLRRYLDFEHNPLKLLYGWIEYWKLRRFEASVCASVACVLACSDVDRDLISGFAPAATVAVVPNTIDTEAYRPWEEEDPSTLVFAAAMDWYPNRDAVQFFVRSILPELRRLVPRFKFKVAGRNLPDNFRRSLASIPEVEFTGTVPDIRPMVGQAAVSVVPLRIGSGTRLKIIEAAALAKPIVSTTLGAEGLEFADGSEILIADEPAAFARAVADLLADAPRRRRMGEAARRRVEQCYSARVLRRCLREVFSTHPLEGLASPTVQMTASRKPHSVFGGGIE